MEDDAAHELSPLTEQMWQIVCDVARAGHAGDAHGFRHHLLRLQTEAHDVQRAVPVLRVLVATLVTRGTVAVPTRQQLHDLAADRVSDVQLLVTTDVDALEAVLLTACGHESHAPSGSKLVILLAAVLGRFVDDPERDLPGLRQIADESR